MLTPYPRVNVKLFAGIVNVSLVVKVTDVDKGPNQRRLPDPIVGLSKTPIVVMGLPLLLMLLQAIELLFLIEDELVKSVLATAAFHEICGRGDVPISNPSVVPIV